MMPADHADRLKQIMADLAYYEKAQATMGGGQPPTIYADKYVQDIKFLLEVAGQNMRGVEVVGEMPKTETETALEHDQAGRVERKTKRS